MHAIRTIIIANIVPYANDNLPFENLWKAF